MHAGVDRGVTVYSHWKWKYMEVRIAYLVPSTHTKNYGGLRLCNLL